MGPLLWVFTMMWSLPVGNARTQAIKTIIHPLKTHRLIKHNLRMDMLDHYYFLQKRNVPPDQRTRLTKNGVLHRQMSVPP